MNESLNKTCACAALCTVDTSFTDSTGLIRYSITPCLNIAAAFEISGFPVRTITGTDGNCERKYAIASMPLTLGIYRSQMMASTSRAFPSAFMAAIPFSPSSASTTSKPALVRSKLIDLRTTASSSTTSTLPIPMAPSFRHCVNRYAVRYTQLPQAANSCTTRTRPCFWPSVADVCNPIANLFPLVLNGKSESERGPFPLLARHTDRTPVLRHDLVHDAQAQARSLPRLLRREERVVDLVQHRFRNPATGVRDLGDHVLALNAGGQAEAALAFHRLHGVPKQVDEHLVDLDPSSQEPRHVLKLRDDFHLPKIG